jgi:hypothetical protein
MVEGLLQFLNDFFDRALQSIVTDRPLFAGLQHSVQKLLSVEWLMAAVSLNDPQIAPLDLLVSRETMLACQAFTTTPDCRPGFRRP